jgi:hypothetical protein
LWTTFHPNHQEANVGGGDAGDAGGLAKGLRADFVEFLAGFFAEAWDGCVVKPSGDLFVFHGLETSDVFVLARDVASVFEGDLDLLDNLGGKAGIRIGKVAVRDFRAF